MSLRASSMSSAGGILVGVLLGRIGLAPLAPLALALALSFALALAFASAFASAFALAFALAFTLALTLALTLPFSLGLPLTFPFALAFTLAFALAFTLPSPLPAAFAVALGSVFCVLLGRLGGLHVLGEPARLVGQPCCSPESGFMAPPPLVRPWTSFCCLMSLLTRCQVFENPLLLRLEEFRLVLALQQLQQGEEVLLDFRLVLQGAGELVFLQQVDDALELEVHLPLLALLDGLLRQRGAAGIGGAVEFAHAKERLFQPLEGVGDALLVGWTVFPPRPARPSRRPCRSGPRAPLGAARRGREHGNQPAEAGASDELSQDGHVYFSNKSRIRLSCRFLVCFAHPFLLLDNITQRLHKLVVV